MRISDWSSDVCSSDLSDEAVCAKWVENPYFQFFCGEQFFRHKLVFDRSSMTRWRGRIGAEQLELLLAETLSVAMRTEATTQAACERVTVDTTVQNKAVAHPTDRKSTRLNPSHQCAYRM